MKTIDPVVGTWELNLAKSKFINGPSPMNFKSATRTYTQGPEGITGTVKAVKAVKPDGSPFFEQMTSKLDGNLDGNYEPHIGNHLMDSMAHEQVDANTVLFAAKMAGEVMGIGTRTISADGKVGYTLATQA